MNICILAAISQVNAYCLLCPETVLKLAFAFFASDTLQKNLLLGLATFPALAIAGTRFRVGLGNHIYVFQSVGARRLLTTHPRACGPPSSRSPPSRVSSAL